MKGFHNSIHPRVNPPNIPVGLPCLQWVRRQIKDKLDDLDERKRAIEATIESCRTETEYSQAELYLSYYSSL